MANQASGLASDFVVRSLAETEELAGRIAPSLRKGDTIVLNGDLGAGKTTFVRAILRAAGVREEVPSPSFTLVQEYEANGCRFTHCDLYRIESPQELDEMGIEDATADGVVLIEWPERGGSRIPSGALNIHIDILGENERRIRLSGSPRWSDVIGERT